MKAGDHDARSPGNAPTRSEVTQATFDVVVLGGSIAGLAIARHLRNGSASVRVALVEKSALPAVPTRSKVGESSTEVSSWYLGDRLGMSGHLEAAQLKKLGLRFFLAAGEGQPFGQRPELGLLSPSLTGFSLPFSGLNPVTWQIHRGRLEHTLFQELTLNNVQIYDSTTGSVRLGNPHQVTLNEESGTSVISARWIIDATGSAKGLPAAGNDDRPLNHHAQASWFWVDHLINPDEFSVDGAFRGSIAPNLRWRSTNHLVGRGYWVWLIALSDGSTSVGVVSDPTVHAAAALDTLSATRDWIAKYEPELYCALGKAEWHGFASRGWQSHVRQTLVSPERWAVTGDTAAFLDPLFSSGLDFMAIGNELIVPHILADLAGEEIGARARRASALFNRIVEQYFLLYRGVYRVTEHPRVMAAKLIWDITVYLGFLAPAVRSGQLANEAFTGRLSFLGQAVGILQTGVSALIVDWATKAAPRPATGRVDQAGFGPLSSVVERMREMQNGADEIQLLTANVRLLEQLAVGLFRLAVADLAIAAPSGPVNPYALSLDPRRWTNDGLERGASCTQAGPELMAILQRTTLRDEPELSP